MSNMNRLMIVSITLGMVMTGCTKPERYGEPLREAHPTPIATLLSRPVAWPDTTVTIAGRIVRECPSGCWFEVSDGKALLYVDIGAHGLAIPQRVGRRVTVQGRLEAARGGVYLVGQGLEIR